MATLKSLVDETTNIKNELKICHTNIKNNLVEKGVECSDSDKLLSLVDKVNLVPVKKIATGVIPETISTSAGSKTFQEFIINTNLDFIPSKILLYVHNVSYEYDKEYLLNSIISSEYCYDESNYFSLIKQGTTACAMVYISNITKDSFSIFLKNGYSSYRAKLWTPMKWHACE